MIKSEHWLIFFAAIFLCIAFPFFFNSKYVEIEQKESLILKENSISACKSVIEAIYKDGENIFNTKETREKAVDVFFTSLGKSLNYNTEENKNALKYRVPCLILVDWDGYYIHYMSEYKDLHDKSIFKGQITDINTWTKAYGDYLVRYNLNGYTEVRVLNQNKKYEGKPKEIYENLGMPSELRFMNDEEDFAMEKNHIIVSCINEQLDYYVNTHNDFYNTEEVIHRITLAESSNEGTSSLLKMPSVIAFVQGAQKESANITVDIYGFAATDIMENRIYYIEKSSYDGVLYYHEKNCPELNLYELCGSMYECAKRGANPCSCVR